MSSKNGREKIVNLINTREFWIAERFNTSDWNSPPMAVKRPPSMIVPEEKKQKDKADHQRMRIKLA